MINVKLLDGSEKQLDKPVSGAAFAESISKSLAKKAVAIRIDGILKDLSTLIDNNSAVEVITHDSPDGLELLRHDAAHVMAEAVQELFPGTQVTIGPVIENGFYYDFARNEPFHESDLEAIEARMREIVDRDEAITREVWECDQAAEYFKSIGEQYKVEIVQDLPPDEEVSIYRQGAFLDLCRGPHLSSTGKLGKAFKLTKLAGAYWRGADVYHGSADYWSEAEWWQQHAWEEEAGRDAPAAKSKSKGSYDRQQSTFGKGWKHHR